MSVELSPNEFEVFRWYITEHYLEILKAGSDCDVCAGTQLDFKTGLHLLYMLGEIEGGAGSSKGLGVQAANRWIGFVQGVLFQAGVCTIDQLRADTTMCMHKAAIYNHINVTPSEKFSNAWQVQVYGGEVVDDFMEGYEDEHEVCRQAVTILYEGKWQRMPALTQKNPVRGEPNTFTTTDITVGTGHRAGNVNEAEARSCVAEAAALFKAHSARNREKNGLGLVLTERPEQFE